MLNTKLWPFSLLLLASLWLPTIIQAEENAQTVQEKLNQSQSNMDKLKESLATHKKTEIKHQSELTALDREISHKTKELEQIQQAVLQKEKHLQGLEETQKQFGLELEKQQALLAKQLKALYALEKNNGLKMLMNLESKETLDRLMNYYPYLKTAYLHAISNSTTQLEKIEQNKLILVEEKKALTQLVAKQAKQIEEVNQLKNKYVTLLQTIQSQMLAEKHQLQLIQAEEKHLIARLKVLEETVSDLPPPSPAWRSFGGSKGRLTFPMQGQKALAIKTKLPSTSNGNPVMISAEPGQEVRSIYYGRVVFAEPLRGFGLLMIIDHGGGYMSLYGHNQELYKKVGDSVQAGQMIGRVAKTSELENSRLYFEIRKNGKPINLVGWFK